jgi:uncharacterized protein YkwD
MEDARVVLRIACMPLALILLVTTCITFMTASDANAKSAPHHRSRRSAYRFKPMERCFMRKINHRRARSGRRHLRWDKQIGYVARRHARRMARHRSVWHDGRLGRLVTHWRALGQNTGGGYRCGSLFRRFWRSSAHRSNILGRWRFLGVGTKRRRGYLYVQQVFEYRWNPGNVFRYP